MTRSFRQEAGFTIIEVLVGAFVLVVGMLAVASLIDGANQSTVSVQSRVAATNVARELVEAGRGVTYNGIADGTVLQQIQSSNPALADEEAGLPYTIERQGVVYTITSDTCIMDDGRDGGGVAPRNGDYCPDSVAPGTLSPPPGSRTDRIPEDYKRIMVRAEWTHRASTRNVVQTTIVNNPGSAGAPAVLTLTAPALGSPPQQVGPGATSVNFNLTTSSAPHTLKWLLDGVSQDLVCSGGCTGKSFAFTWNLQSPVVADDGPFLVSAEAYDSFNVNGPSRSMTVVVNRSQPIAPRGFAGGRNNLGEVELEWLANPERDLVGYDVVRLGGAGPVAICGLSLKTTCTDPNPPAGELTYRIHAWDTELNSTTARRSPAYSDRIVLEKNNPPFAPTDGTLTSNGGGSYSLRWHKAVPKEDPDQGDFVAFYRIYRDGTAFANRYARADATGGTHEFIDHLAPGETHTYYVSAVDTQYRESTLLGPIG